MEWTSFIVGRRGAGLAEAKNKTLDAEFVTLMEEFNNINININVVVLLPN